jgi:N-formylglutamate amidohydrolase
MIMDTPESEQTVAPFEIRLPAVGRVPVLVSMPHTGVCVTSEVDASFADPVMAELPMTDWHLHHLYDFLPELGVTTIHAVYSRFMVDLNRSPTAAPLYPGRFETSLVPTETFHGEPIFRDPPDAEEIERRRRLYHAPYHAALLQSLKDLRQQFGRAVVVDVHSIASVANRLHDELRDDIYLGDRDGQTCGSWLRTTLAKAFTEQGLRVAINDPYKGGYITDHYGRVEDVEAIQIEMCQRVYMEEGRPDTALGSPRFEAAKDMLRQIFVELLAGFRARYG